MIAAIVMAASVVTSDGTNWHEILSPPMKSAMHITSQGRVLLRVYPDSTFKCLRKADAQDMGNMQAKPEVLVAYIALCGSPRK